MYLPDQEFMKQLQEQREAERLANQSRALTYSREIVSSLLEESMGIAADLGARADAGTIAAILGSLTSVFISEMKNELR